MPPATSGFNSVLCGIDFSDDSRSALQYAAAVAKRGGGRVSVLFVNDPLLARAGATTYNAKAIEEATERELSKFISSALGSRDAALTAGVLTLGQPAAEITSAAKRLRSDLIVLGTRGLGGAGKLFFGSTTSRVLRTTECPILAVPRGRRRQGIPAPWPTRILAAIKPGDEASSDARVAAHIARWWDVPLTLATVVAPVQSPLWLLRKGRVDDRVRLKDARTTLGRIAQKLEADDVDVRALLGNPAEQIAAASVDSRSDLIILRLRGDEGGFLGARQGSVTYRVLAATKTPVLALP